MESRALLTSTLGFALAILAGGCGSSDAAPADNAGAGSGQGGQGFGASSARGGSSASSGGGGAAPSNGGGDASAGTAGAGVGGTAGAGTVTDDFWTHKKGVGASDNLLNLFVVSPEHWILQQGLPYTSQRHAQTFDAGKTWASLDSGFADVPFIDSSFWVLGVTRAGQILGASELTPEFSDSLALMEYDVDARVWHATDAMPKPEAEPRFEPRDLASSTEHVWLHDRQDPTKPIYQFDGPGMFTAISLPAFSGPYFAATPEGTLYIFKDKSLFERVGEGDWQPLALPEEGQFPRSYGPLRVADDGQLFLVRLDATLFRRDGETWTIVTPPLNITKTSDYAYDTAVSGSGVLVFTARYLAHDTSVPAPLPSTRVFLSPDRGATWVEHSLDRSPEAFSFDDDERVYLTFRDKQGLDVYVSPPPSAW